MGFLGSSSSHSGGSIINVQHASARTADDASVSVFKQLMPQSEWEWRAMLAVAAVRFVLLPAATCALVLGASNAGLLPPDPACVFMLLLQSCMPPGTLRVLANLKIISALPPSALHVALIKPTAACSHVDKSTGICISGCIYSRL
jgi:hypothetical protein